VQRRRLRNRRGIAYQEGNEEGQRRHTDCHEQEPDVFWIGLADLRRTEPNNEDARIFPMMYAPVLVSENGKTIIRPMRYACRLAGKPADYDKTFPRHLQRAP
jgi:hypothetical protein